MLRMTMRASFAALLLALSCSTGAHAQQTTLPLWPHATPEPPQTTEPESDATKPTDGTISGHRTRRITNITTPTLSVYPPPSTHNTHTAALVFPGGGYRILAWDGEGVDVCRWLNAVGMTCLLVKYRVPEEAHYPDNPADLEDAQQAMRLARYHAADWRIDPTHIGVIGFSAGANLAVLLSTHPDDTHIESTPAAAETDAHVDARPDFAILGYPAYLAAPPDQLTLDPVYTPNQYTPPTFLIQAEDDKGYGKNALVYYRALLDAHIPSELHYFATGGHGFGVFPIDRPETNWTQLATAWLRSIHMLPPPPPHPIPNPTVGGTGVPCPVPQPPPAGRPTNASSNTSVATTTDPNCW